MTATTIDDTGRNDVRVLSLVGVGHFVSHLYWLALPPLFLQLRDAFGVSYTELGLMMALMAGASTVVQVPVGFMVDRYGARPMLVGGLAILAGAFALMALAPNFWVLIALAIVAGIGNSVFHPADYAILNSSISPHRMGRAFSIHLFAGNMGSAVAPALMIALSAVFGWRGGLLAIGLGGLALVAVILSQWHTFKDVGAKPRKDKSGADDAQDGWRLLLSPAVLLFFMFFLTLSMTAGAMQAFSVTALVNLHGTPAAAASTALSIYLFCLAGGTLVGGEITDRTSRHEIVAGAVFVLTAVFTAILAVIKLDMITLCVLMGVMGLGQGIIRPTRDMMLRAASPKGSTGKVFGFVSAGIVAGAAVAPVPFGYLIDIGRPEWVFYLIAVFMLICLFTVIVPKDIAAAAAGRKAEPAKG